MTTRRTIPRDIPHEYGIHIENRCGYHAVRINDILYPYVGECARISIDQVAVRCINDIPVYQNNPSTLLVRGLPAPRADTYYIVSELTARLLPDRTDLLVPNPDKANYNSRSRICQADSFMTMARLL